MEPPNKFLKRLASPDPIICAEGYLFELERRGYVQIGPFVPEVVVNDPEVVKQLHREFVRAGSDVVEAFTYYGHRTKLKLIGKEHLVENLNRTALRLAREIVDEFPEKKPALGREYF
jgi:betaine-homocysteine S-methyltransferase